MVFPFVLPFPQKKKKRKERKTDHDDITEILLKGGVSGMVFNATIMNISVISWRSVLYVVETGLPGENHRPVASY